MFGAAELYGAQPIPTPTAVTSPEQVAMAPRARQADKPRRDGDGASAEAAEETGQRAALLLVILVGVAIALGWVAVTGSIRIGK